MSWVSLERLQKSPVLAAVAVGLLQDLAQAACASIERYIGRPLELKERTEKYDGDDRRTLFLNVFPVTILTEIIVTDSDGAATTHTTDFDIDLNTGEVRWKPTSSGRFVKGFQNIQAKYTAGGDPVLADLQSAVVMIVSKTVALEKGEARVVQEKVGQAMVKYQVAGDNSGDPTDWPPEATAIIDRYAEQML